MKTMINKIAIAVVIAMFANVHLMAFNDSLKVTGTNKLKLELTDVSKTIRIAFTDRDNNILFEQTINNTKKYSRTLNMELLADGEYTVKIEDETRVKTIPVSILKNVVYVPYPEMNEHFKPVVNEKGSRVYVSQFAPGRTPLYVAIYNSNGEMVHEETLAGKMELGRIFDFSGSMHGKYRIYLESKGMAYDHLVYIGK